MCQKLLKMLDMGQLLAIWRRKGVFCSNFEHLNILGWINTALLQHYCQYLQCFRSIFNIKTCKGQNQSFHKPLPLEGRHNARNLLLACAVATELGVHASSLDSITVNVPGGRNRRVQVGSLTVLDETYNASPEAVLAALDLLAAAPGRRFAVLGTMLELGENSVALHRSVAAHAATLGVNGLVLVADSPEAAAMEAAAAGLQHVAVVQSPEQAALPLQQWLRPGDTVLLKASRGVAMERLLPLLPDL